MHGDVAIVVCEGDRRECADELGCVLSGTGDIFEGKVGEARQRCCD